MKSIFSILIMLATTIIFSCKPAAEDRVKMHEKAKRISDSIAKTIDVPLNEVRPK